MPSSFGDRLKKLRKERDITMDELIEELNKIIPGLLLDKSVISRYENKKAMPKNFAIVEGMADYFGVQIGYLMGKTDNRYGDENKYRIIPVLGTIAAGTPILAQEHIESYEYISEDSQATFCLRVKGDSMSGARIHDGDIVFIRKQPDVESGEVAAVLIDGEEATLKRIFKVNGNIILHSDNPCYQDKVFSRKDMKELNIIGKAIAFKSEVK